MQRENVNSGAVVRHPTPPPGRMIGNFVAYESLSLKKPGIEDYRPFETICTSFVGIDDIAHGFGTQ